MTIYELGILTLKGNPVTTTGDVSGGRVIADNLTLDGNTIYATDINGNINLDPEGSGTVNVTNARITSLGTPVNDTDAANKIYVDSLVTGFSFDRKESVLVGSTVSLADGVGGILISYQYFSTGGTNGSGQISATLSGTTLTIDDVVLSSSNNGARILLKNQTDTESNGIWILTITGDTFTMERSSDFNSSSVVSSAAFMFVESGTVNDNTGWMLSTNTVVNIGGASGTGLTFVPFTGTDNITAGNRLVRNADVIGLDTTFENTLTTLTGSQTLTNKILQLPMSYSPTIFNGTYFISGITSVGEELFYTGSTTSNEVISPIIRQLATGEVMNFSIRVVGKTAAGLSIGSNVHGLVKESGGSAITVGNMDIGTYRDAGLEDVVINVVGSTDTLHLDITGLSGVSMTWVCAFKNVSL